MTTAFDCEHKSAPESFSCCKKYYRLYLNEAMPDVTFTPKQAECAYWLSRSYKQHEIASKMRLSVRTIEHHILALRKKMKTKAARELIDLLNPDLIDRGRLPSQTKVRPINESKPDSEKLKMWVFFNAFFPDMKRARLGLSGVFEGMFLTSKQAELGYLLTQGFSNKDIVKKSFFFLNNPRRLFNSLAGLKKKFNCQSRSNLINILSSIDWEELAGYSRLPQKSFATIELLRNAVACLKIVEGTKRYCCLLFELIFAIMGYYESPKE